MPSALHSSASRNICVNCVVRQIESEPGHSATHMLRERGHTVPAGFPECMGKALGSRLRVSWLFNRHAGTHRVKLKRWTARGNQERSGAINYHDNMALGVRFVG